jgi:multidrug efflux pump subunit AcrA (membrane-fusion protein)
MKKNWLKKSVFTVIILLALAGFLFIPSMMAGNGTAGGANPRAMMAGGPAVFSVRAEEAQVLTLHAFLDVNGDIVSSQQADVFPDVSGRLVSVRVGLGSYVRQGEIIAEIDPSRPGTTFMNSPVYAPISGIVSKTPLSIGMTVGTNTSITVISSNGSTEITARIPEREIAGIVPGLKAEVSLQAYPGETFTATVTQVSPVLDSASRTKLINLTFDQNDDRVKAGMFARISINTRSYNDVLTIPSEAVVSNRGVDTVFVLSLDNAGQPIVTRREVSTGVTLQGLTEIKSGLAQGVAVIVQGQQLLSGGERVRVIGDFIVQADNTPAESVRQEMPTSGDRPDGAIPGTRPEGTMPEGSRPGGAR